MRKISGRKGHVNGDPSKHKHDRLTPKHRKQVNEAIRDLKSRGKTAPNESGARVRLPKQIQGGSWFRTCANTDELDHE